MNVNITALLGKTLARIDGGEEGSEHIGFICTDGSTFTMYHQRDCCESVSVEEIVGDINDLIGEPILRAEEAESGDEMPWAHTEEEIAHQVSNRLLGKKPKEDDGGDSHTWTFYKLATRKGYVDFRWYGSSNGYYSEGVSFVQHTGASA
jgi:hypothetical protein